MPASHEPRNQPPADVSRPAGQEDVVRGDIALSFPTICE